MATPLVSGLAALVWTQYPSATASEVAARIINGAEDLGSAGWDPIYGWGRINAARAFYPLSGAAVGSATVSGSTSDVALGAEPLARVEAPPSHYVRGQLIVRMSGLLSARQREELFAGYGLSLQRAGTTEGLYLLRVPEGQEMDLAAALRELTNVVYAQPNYVLSAAQ
jgi:hypothetical protein